MSAGDNGLARAQARWDAAEPDVQEAKYEDCAECEGCGYVDATYTGRLGGGKDGKVWKIEVDCPVCKGEGEIPIDPDTIDREETEPDHEA
jgi:RecJ-like exonuclease